MTVWIGAGRFGAAFVPTSLSGLQGWYDASDAASITDTGAGAVSQWNDKSGNVRHLTQGTGGARPTTGTNSQNGLNVLTFDSGDFLAAATAADWKFLHATGGSTTFFVANYTTGTKTVLGTAAYSTSSTGVVMAGNGGAFYSIGVRGGGAANYEDTSATWAGGAYNVVAVRLDTGNGTAASRCQINIDGGASTGNNALTNAASTSNPAFALHVGRVTSGGANPFIGQIAEIIIYNTLLGTSDRQLVEAYLKTKWGTP